MLSGEELSIAAVLTGIIIAQGTTTDEMQRLSDFLQVLSDTLQLIADERERGEARASARALAGAPARASDRESNSSQGDILHALTRRRIVSGLL